MKKILSLVLALCMVLTIGAAFATSVGELTADTTISISDVVAGDIVKLYKVLAWTDGVGWTATSDFDGLKTTALADYIANDKDAALTKEEVAAIATAAQGKTPINGNDGEVATGTTYTYTVDATSATSGVGMYLALITAKEAGTVYNPIIVSADFDRNDTDTISTSEKIVGTAVAKKQDLTIEKTEPKITNDVGDTYNYTIETTIPNYSEAFTNQFFTLKDTVSEYLDIVDSSIKVTVTGTDTEIDVSSYLTVHDHDFTIAFPHAYVSALQNPQKITVKYDAKLNVPVEQLTNVKEENNKVTVEFPNDPSDLTGKKVTALKDETREYTFSIDGELFGNSDWKNSELIKVGKNADGSWVTDVYKQSSGHESGPLEGAKYGLYTSKSAAENAMETTDENAQKTGLYTNDVFNGIVITDAHGLMEMNGLDAGTYYLAELAAPAGYVRDQDVHEVKIETVIENTNVTEYYTVSDTGVVTWHTDNVAGSTPYTYTVPVLKSYTVTIDGKTTSTYTMTLDGPSISTVTPAINDTDLVNTKGVELPHTGGIGTTIFYIVGGILLIGAAVILVARRKAQD